MKRSGFKRIADYDPGELWFRVVESRDNFDCYFRNQDGVDCHERAMVNKIDTVDFRKKDCAHILPKSLLRRTFPNGYPFGAHLPGGIEPRLSIGQILMDPRNCITLCRYHHHKLDNYQLELTLDDLPESVFDFADEFGLMNLLEADRRFLRRAA